MDKHRTKILIIGIDGATWDIINPLIEEGKAPNFKKLKNKGAWARIESIDPPLTPIVWTSIASGKMKEKHGILDFFGTSCNVRVKRIWDILEKHGYSIGLHEYPVTWPPRECNGFIIPDFFARDASTFPQELSFIKELAIGKKNERSFGMRKYLLFLYKTYRYGLQLGTLWKVLKYFIRRRMSTFSPRDDFHKSRMLKLYLYSDIFINLYRRYQPDFAVTYFNQPDALGHRFWKYMDPEGFANIPPKEIKKYGKVIKEAYMAIDKEIGRLLQYTSRHTLIAVVSDHGFRKTTTNPYGKSLRIRLEALMEALNFPGDVVGVNVHISSYFRSQKHKTAERATSKEELIEKLKGVQFTKDGQKIYEIVSRGEWIIVDTISTVDIPPQTPLRGTCYRYGDFIEDRLGDISGDHDKFGIFLISGEKIRKNFEIQNASVLDVTPTILAAIELPVAEDMDGRILLDIFEPDWLKRKKPQFIETYEERGQIQLHARKEESAEEGLEDLKDELRALGYL
ncbi:MAG: alkaline phosphatase family protein [Candidatus Omnitrophica bacterium]|nr:alkaline phosphatase family protein [Candidatus Omnitrophota bacterium]